METQKTQSVENLTAIAEKIESISKKREAASKTLNKLLTDDVMPLAIRMMDVYEVDKLVIITQNKAFKGQRKIDDYRDDTEYYAACVYSDGEVRECTIVDRGDIVPCKDSYSLGWFGNRNKPVAVMARIGIREFITELINRMIRLNNDFEKITIEDEEFVNRLKEVIK